MMHKESYQEAGTIAGLNVLELSMEPTAASLAYGLNKRWRKSLVYDLVEELLTLLF